MEKFRIKKTFSHGAREKVVIYYIKSLDFTDV